MYIPSQYKNENKEDIIAFLKTNAFGILITHTNNRSLATHIPLEYEEKEDGTAIVHGHLSKANEQCTHLQEGTEALCIFNGPHSYVSSSWYDFEEVPTWNYIAVHLRGKLSILNEDALYQSLKKLTDKYEATQQNPVSLETLSAKTLRQMKGIIGFEITIDTLEAAYKLSQNRDTKNHNAIVNCLRETGDSGSVAIADHMEKTQPKNTSPLKRGD